MQRQVIEAPRMSYSNLIRSDLILRHCEALHAHCVSLGLGSIGLLPLCAFHPTDGKSCIAKFAIGDAAKMAHLATRWSNEFNVYAPMHLVRSDLPSNKRGKGGDITAVFGLVMDADSDIDRDHV